MWLFIRGCCTQRHRREIYSQLSCTVASHCFMIQFFPLEDQFYIYQPHSGFHRLILIYSCIVYCPRYLDGSYKTVHITVIEEKHMEVSLSPQALFTGLVLQWNLCWAYSLANCIQKGESALQNNALEMGRKNEGVLIESSNLRAEALTANSFISVLSYINTHKGNVLSCSCRFPDL